MGSPYVGAVNTYKVFKQFSRHHVYDLRSVSTWRRIQGIFLHDFITAQVGHRIPNATGEKQHGIISSDRNVCELHKLQFS